MKETSRGFSVQPMGSVQRSFEPWCGCPKVMFEVLEIDLFPCINGHFTPVFSSFQPLSYQFVQFHDVI